jgi:hypothetical protein
MKKSEVTDEHIAYLWRCMVMFYGYRWLNSYGEADDGTWRAGLCDVTPDQILHGIDSLRLSGKEWPPTLPEFRKMCVPVVVPYHVPHQRRLEQYVDWDKNLARLTTLKAILGIKKHNAGK